MPSTTDMFIDRSDIVELQRFSLSNNQVILWRTGSRGEPFEEYLGIESRFTCHEKSVCVDDVHGSPPLGLFVISTVSLVSCVAQHQIIL